MSELTPVRFLFLFGVGIFLMRSLLYISTSVEPRRLKRRINRNKRRNDKACLIIYHIYLLLLLTGLILLFAYLRYKAKIIWQFIKML